MTPIVAKDRKMVRSHAYCEARIGNGNPNFKGYKDLTLTYFNNVRASALKRGLRFKVTMRQLWRKLEAQNRQCALTGLPITLATAKKVFEGTASVDRIDSTKGYTMDNVQWVHKRVNSMKSDMTEEEFFRFCKFVVVHQSKRF